MSVKSFIDEKYLLKPTTPESAYILGFLWGDGSVLEKRKRIQIELVRDDLDTIRPIFNKVGKWYYSTRNRPNRREQASLATNNKLLANELLKLDYGIKSIETPAKVLKLIPKKYQRYFFLGWFDADGCFYRNKKQYLIQCSLAGSYNQNWKVFSNLLNKLDINYQIKRSVHKTSASSIIRFGGKINVMKFIQFLYPKHFEFGLQRKFTKIEDLVNKI